MTGGLRYHLFGNMPCLFHAETLPTPLSDSLFFLQAITAMNFKQPTPIQKACIPVGLLGKDICACAATGTGNKDRDLGGEGRGRRRMFNLEQALS